MGIIAGELLPVNGYLAQEMYQTDIVTLRDGGFAVVWSGGDADGTANVRLCVFNADGSLRSATDVPASVHVAGDQSTPQLTALADGGFAVVWSGETSADRDGIALRLFNADGTARAIAETDADILVNTQVDGRQFAPQITTLSDGGFVVAWSDTTASDGGTTGLALRIFDKDGTVRSDAADIRIEPFADDQGGFAIAALVGGGFVVVHETPASGDEPSSRLTMEIFDACGTLTKETVVPVFSGKVGMQGHPAVTALADGGFVVAWEGDRIDDNAGIALQIFDADGSARAATDIRGNAFTEGDQVQPIVTALKDGGFVVLWSGASTFDADGLAMQVYNADGKTRIPGDIPVNVETRGIQGSPHVAALAGGGFAVTWITQDKDGYGISLRVFNAAGTARMSIDEPVGDATTLPQGLPKIAALQDGGLALTWQAKDDNGVHIYEKVYRAVNDAPTGEDTIRAIKEDGRYVFSVDDFGFRDANGDTLKAVKIAALPANGTLTLDGWPVVAGQEIKAADIEAGKLVWKASANLNGTALGALMFNVIDTGGTDFKGEDTDQIARKITFDVAEVNDDPVAKALNGSTYENTPFKIEVADAVMDLDDDKLTMINAKIVSGFGSVMIDAKKMLVYNPMAGPNPNIGDGDTRTVVISYTVSDGKGGTATATITLTVLGISADIFSGTSGADNLAGTSYGDLMYGKGGNDTLRGGSGNDLLDGGSGADTMKGEAGNDSYLVDNAGDKVIEAANGGTDAVQATRSYTLTDNVEKLILIGSSNYNGIGNALANTIIGNSGLNILKGLGGNDQLSGGAGNDCLDGGNGNDALNGGTGADKLIGAAGDDTYVVDNAGDIVIEAANGGTDTVQATRSYTLTANVEKLILIGSGNYSGTGNALANTITGNGGSNTLQGLGGNDRLSGGAGNDCLYGGDGNDALNGGSGADRLIGGAGDDIYVVDHAGDIVVEATGGGADTVTAGCSYTLAGNVERLILTGTGGYAGTGNALSNRIVGNAAANTLKGLDGDDLLYGGRGNDRIYGGNGNDRIDGGAEADVLSGGSGCDTFVFRAASDSTVSSPGRDTIADFSKGDRIDLGAIDARASSSADNAFVFIGNSNFTKCAGELRYQKSGSDTLVSGDTDGDGRADFSILVSGNITFTKGDFLL